MGMDSIFGKKSLMDPIHVNGESCIHSKVNGKQACNNVKPFPMAAPCSHWKVCVVPYSAENTVSV